MGLSSPAQPEATRARKVGVSDRLNETVPARRTRRAVKAEDGSQSPRRADAPLLCSTARDQRPPMASRCMCRGCGLCDVPVALVTAVDAALAAQQKAGWPETLRPRARFRVMVSTGLRPSQLKRLTPCALDLKRDPLVAPRAASPSAMYLDDEILFVDVVQPAAASVGPDQHAELRTPLRTAGWRLDIRPHYVRHAHRPRPERAGRTFRDIAVWLGIATPRRRAPTACRCSTAGRAHERTAERGLGRGEGPEKGSEKRRETAGKLGQIRMRRVQAKTGLNFSIRGPF